MFIGEGVAPQARSGSALCAIRALPPATAAVFRNWRLVVICGSPSFRSPRRYYGSEGRTAWPLQSAIEPALWRGRTLGICYLVPAERALSMRCQASRAADLASCHVRDEPSRCFSHPRASSASTSSNVLPGCSL